MNDGGTQSRSARVACALLTLAVIALVAALVGPTVGVPEREPGADERYYLHYMQAVSSGGPSALPGLFDEWLGDPQHWIFPPPSRVAFVAASAAWARVFGATLLALMQMSFAAYLAVIAVQYLFARRHLGEWRAVLIAALTAFSPLYLGLSRTALSDSFITLWQVLSLWLFYELVREPHRVVWRVAFAAAFTFAILTKEISGLLGVAFVAFACIERFHRKRPLPLLAVAVPLAVAPLASVAIWALAAGGFGALRETLRIVLESPATNEFAIRWGSGPWYRYVLDQLVMSPWTTLLGIAAVAVVAWRWRTGRYDSLLVYCALLYVAQIAVLAPFTKNLRYVAVLEAPVRALAVVTICGALALERRRLALFAQAAVVAALCVVDFGVYDTFYLRSTLYDPVSAKILRMRSMVPRANQELTPAGTRGRNVRERGRGERDDTQR